jgi:hypothetical protein
MFRSYHSTSFWRTGRPEGQKTFRSCGTEPQSKDRQTEILALLSTHTRSTLQNLQQHSVQQEVLPLMSFYRRPARRQTMTQLLVEKAVDLSRKEAALGKMGCPKTFHRLSTPLVTTHQSLMMMLCQTMASGPQRAPVVQTQRPRLRRQKCQMQQRGALMISM